ncbi:phosphopantetheine-binding protein [Streptomyces sp. NBC_00986]|uniref:phosphopantetheine-binding protein n=1 Tax=Streptomyces sp. NBC_00986 TaxID=2903702 RepID=UPI003863CC11|nr:phosphopantetheine-binding protein [Streptomyces sp. NBC_00986]WSX64474.1 phosphopantetheine-binding protein [Streptomyces sp. NBC_00986]
MTSAPHTVSGTPSRTRGSGWFTEFTAVLADVLGLRPEQIDPGQTFRSLGLDSMLAMEFVAVVNARYGTRIATPAILDHPTPFAFAHHVACEAGVPGPAPAPAAGPPLAAGADPTPVVDVLREQLAGILCCDPWDIGAATTFDALGLDSLLGAEFVAGINRLYGLQERAAVLYDHPTIGAMAARIGARSASVPDSATAQATRPAPDREASLRAVRDHRLGVDEEGPSLAGSV